jgi:hypothetical protein
MYCYVVYYVMCQVFSVTCVRVCVCVCVCVCVYIYIYVSDLINALRDLGQHRPHHAERSSGTR